MVLGFRVGDDPAIDLKADDFTGARRVFGLPAGTAPLGRVFPAGPAFGTSTRPAALVAALAAAAEPVLAAGMWPFLSLKPDVAQCMSNQLAGHFAAVGRWAAGLGVPVYLTVWHEPENDSMAAGATAYTTRASNFVSMYQAAYRAAKATAGDALRMGPVHMAYQWRPGSPTTAPSRLAAAWRVPDGYRDWFGVDTYTANWSWRTVGQTLPVKADFQRWLTALAVPPAEVLVVERGISRTYPGVSDPAYAQMVTLRADYDYLRAIGAHGLMYWHSGGATDDSLFTLAGLGRAMFASMAAESGVPGGAAR